MVPDTGQRDSGRSHPHILTAKARSCALPALSLLHPPPRPRETACPPSQGQEAEGRACPDVQWLRLQGERSVAQGAG